MTGDDAQQGPEHGFERIEDAILSSLSPMLDSLLDAASLARPGSDGISYAADLRALALELETLTVDLDGLAHRQHIRQRFYSGAVAA